MRPSLLNRNLRWFLAGMILANIASEMVFGLLPVYLAELGATVGQIGVVFSIASIVPLILQILGGWLSDSIGRLKVIALGSLAGSFGYVGLVLAPSWHWVLVSLCVEYISGSLVGPSFAAYIAEQSGEDTRGRVFGLSKALFLVVAVAGPLVGGTLAGRYGFKPMLTVACLLYGIATLLRLWMAISRRFAARAGELAPAPPAPEPARPLSLASLRGSLLALGALVFSGGIVTWILITDGISDVAFRLSGELVPLYLSDVGRLTVSDIGRLQALRGLAMIAATIPAGWLSDRTGERGAIIGGFLLQAAGLAVFILAPGLPTFALAAAIFGLGVGTQMPAYDSIVSKAVPEHMRGIAFGLFETSLGVLSLPAPWLGARLWERFTPRLPFIITACAALLAILPVWCKFILPTARPAPIPAPGAES